MDIPMDKETQAQKPVESAQEQEKRRGRQRKESTGTEKRKVGIGADIGTMTVISAVMKDNNNDETTYKVQRDAFFDIENTMMSKAMLNKLESNYIESEDKKLLYVIGDKALEMANFFNREIRRPLSQGVVSTREKEALSMIKLIIHGVLGDPIEENEACHFSVPAAPIDANYNIVYHQNILKSFITSFGYKAIPINEAAAVGLSELENEDFSGLALSFGAGMVNISFLMFGITQPEQQFSIARSGDWIDSNSAIACGLKSSKMTAIKESGVDLLNPKTREETAIRIYYENLIQYTCDALEKKTNSSMTINFENPISVIVSGGTSKAINFEKLFEQELKTKTFPFKIKEVRKAKDQLKAVARGCLLSSLNYLS
jgi:hypothetical protein